MSNSMNKYIKLTTNPDHLPSKLCRDIVPFYTPPDNYDDWKSAEITNRKVQSAMYNLGILRKQCQRFEFRVKDIMRWFQTGWSKNCKEWKHTNLLMFIHWQ